MATPRSTKAKPPAPKARPRFGDTNGSGGKAKVANISKPTNRGRGPKPAHPAVGTGQR